MTAPNPPAPPASAAGVVAPVKKNKMRKVAMASFMGTAIEFYDFNIYSTAAALVFAHAFFPALGTYAGTVVSFATLGIAFVARPIGAILFGHFGDRLGRKRTLITTMVLMGLATVAIGLLPTSETIGILAPILLVLLRVAQGIAAGGEWGGAALFTTENAPKHQRGFWGMFTNLGGSAANMLALGTFLVASYTVSDETFVAWGWRVPFLLSFVLLGVGLWIRLKIEETPVFAKEVRAHGTSKLPVKEAFANQWKTILLGAGCMITFFAFGYLGVAYMTNYGTASLGFSRQMVLAVGVIGAFIQGLAMINGGALSDRIGRRKVLLIFGGIAVPWALILFPLLDTKSVGMYWFALIVTFIIAGHGYGIAGSFLSELFETRYRYTAAGLSYSLAGIIGGAIPPLLAASIITAYGSFTFGLILTGFCLVSFLCILALKETREVSLAHVQENQAEQAAA
jgi:MFS family permease